MPREGSAKKATETVGQVERRGSGGHTDRALMQVKEQIMQFVQ